MGQNHSDRRNHVANGSNVDVFARVIRFGNKTSVSGD